MNQNREITKMTPEEEFMSLLFREPEDVRKVAKSYMTGYTRWYFEAKSNKERDIVKGGTLAMKVLIENHLIASEINSRYNENELDKKVHDWKKRKRS